MKWCRTAIPDNSGKTYEVVQDCNRVEHQKWFITTFSCLGATTRNFKSLTAKGRAGGLAKSGILMRYRLRQLTVKGLLHGFIRRSG